jgi:hypothetical protein
MREATDKMDQILAGQRVSQSIDGQIDGQGA